ncbi:MAG TPA: transglutaminase-like domain-containing protein [Methylomirabilota bacterium]|nr:transglutaminase-like domain-containing protein [Methylomirabilota bacterium]
MERRAFLTAGLGLSATTLAARPLAALAQAAPDTTRWRAFEVTTRAEIVDPAGPVRAWIPLALAPDTDYFKNLGRTWTGNPKSARTARDDRYGASILTVEWEPGEPAPVVEVVMRFATRDRAVDLSKPGDAREDKRVLARYLEPTRLMPTDGIVARTARDITRGRKSDIDKSRAIYEWIVDSTFRDPKVRGCGVGDIRAMLESGNLSGKCADLNALYVGLARAVGIPSRDVYGVRVADSSEFKSLGKSGDITRAQHCRAESFLAGFGWVPVDPADVRKVVLEERGGISLTDPAAQRARAKLFGWWEMNWLAYNYAHDVRLPGSVGDPVGFFMYPQAEVNGERRDSLDPDTFRYRMTAKELSA